MNRRSVFSLLGSALAMVGFTKAASAEVIHIGDPIVTILPTKWDLEGLHAEITFLQAELAKEHPGWTQRHFELLDRLEEIDMAVWSACSRVLSLKNATGQWSTLCGQFQLADRCDRKVEKPSDFFKEFPGAWETLQKRRTV